MVVGSLGMGGCPWYCIKILINKPIAARMSAIVATITSMGPTMAKNVHASNYTQGE